MIDVRIGNRAEGAYADVQGPVPFVATQTARYQGSDAERALLCQTQQLRNAPATGTRQSGCPYPRPRCWGLPPPGRGSRAEWTCACAGCSNPADQDFFCP